MEVRATVESVRMPFVSLMLAAVVLLSVAGVRGRVRADVQPGDVIGREDTDKIHELVSPGLEWCVKHGLPMRIVAPRAIEWPRDYEEAT